MKIGSALSASEKAKITNFLRENQHVFAWKHEESIKELSNIVSTLIWSANQYNKDEEYLHLNTIRQW